MNLKKTVQPQQLLLFLAPIFELQVNNNQLLARLTVELRSKTRRQCRIAVKSPLY